MVGMYVYTYVRMCILYCSGKEERPWPISGAKINNQSINQYFQEDFKSIILA